MERSPRGKIDSRQVPRIEKDVQYLKIMHHL